jgi:hypothetical protein
MENDEYSNKRLEKDYESKSVLMFCSDKGRSAGPRAYNIMLYEETTATQLLENFPDIRSVPEFVVCA